MLFHSTLSEWIRYFCFIFLLIAIPSGIEYRNLRSLLPLLKEWLRMTRAKGSEKAANRRAQNFDLRLPSYQNLIVDTLPPMERCSSFSWTPRRPESHCEPCHVAVVSSRTSSPDSLSSPLSFSLCHLNIETGSRFARHVVILLVICF